MSSEKGFIDDKKFNISHIKYDPDKYEENLDLKIKLVKSLLNECDVPCSPNLAEKIEIFRSPRKHYRQKCRFGIHHHQDSDTIDYTMWDLGEAGVIVKSFPIASKITFRCMALLRRLLNCNELFSPIRTFLRAATFLTSLSREIVICLTYKRDAHKISNSSDHVKSDSGGAIAEIEEEILNKRWMSSAEKLRAQLFDRLSRQPRPDEDYFDSKDLKTCSGDDNSVRALSLSIVGYARGERAVLGNDFVTEQFVMTTSAGKESDDANSPLRAGFPDTLIYKQVENGFSNPNGHVNQASLRWLIDVMSGIDCFGGETRAGLRDAPTRRDLLEMYCGNGNHTCALAGFARRLVAVEINPKLCAAASYNLRLNGIENAYILTSNSSDFANKILCKPQLVITADQVNSLAVGQITFKRKTKLERYLEHQAATSGLSQGSGSESVPTEEDHKEEENLGGASKEALHFDFGGVLVDPPRSGLDAHTRKLVARYQHILYISCSPESLFRDVKEICDGGRFQIERFSVFDHFPYTPHLECGAYLRKILNDNG